MNKNLVKKLAIVTDNSSGKAVTRSLEVEINRSRGGLKRKGGSTHHVKDATEDLGWHICRAKLALPLGTKLLHTVFYVLGNYFR